MQRKPGRACLMIAFVCAITTTVVAEAERRPNGRKAAALKAGQVESTQVTIPGATAVAQATPMNIEDPPLQRLDDGGGVAGAPPGTTVYSNEIDPLQVFYKPGAGERMADDLTLGSGPCEVVFYDLLVYSQGTSSPTFDVSTALYDANPCNPDARIIEGTEADFPDVDAFTATVLEATLVPPAEILDTDTVWLAATFSTDDSGWVFAEEAEIGFTGNFWSEDDGTYGCTRLSATGGEPYGGFWANVICSEIPNPPGACCNGGTCTESTEAECASAGGVWQGPFTTCNPDPCLAGACCVGDNFSTCRDTTEAGCTGGFEIFHAGEACGDNPCQPVFGVFENSFVTGFFWSIASDTLWADDLVLGPGAPCELTAYNLSVAGEGGGRFGVHIELWTNDDRGSPNDERDDLPLAPITGTAMDFADIPSDLTTHVLLAEPFDGIELPDKVWMVFSTTSDLAGPVLGGMAHVGFTWDAFAVFNDPEAPGVWTDNFWFGGFDPENCPFEDPCNPAGSFHINVWCAGTPPTGACCSDAAGTCVDEVTLVQCDGRWEPGVTCESEPFNPPCGTSACCYLGNCSDMPPDECVGDPARGLFCADIECPRVECSGASGDCFSDNGTPGCEDAFCCETVCAVDEPCCTDSWDDFCAGEALSLCPGVLTNDHCVDAEVVAGEGDFSFDNSIATTDGPPHDSCGDTDEEKQIYNDVWHCWTASCTDTVYVRTCGLTDVNTKMAVYEGCDTCPPSGANLLACNDDFCGYEDQPVQSQVSFNATAGQSYLIRTGTPLGATGGAGTFNVICGLPRNPACPGTADCCEIAGSPGCMDETCCNTVCACDAFCCEVAWDDNCAGTGVGNSGCGAEALCGSLCVEPCPDGPVTFVDPPDGVVDARQPHRPASAGNRQGIDTITVEAPAGADNPDCWTPCETVVEGSPNEIANIADNGEGMFTLTLDRPISAGGLTTITYAADGGAVYTGTYLSHPANINGNAHANADDLVTLINCCLNRQCDPGPTPAETPYRCDIDHSGRVTPADMLRAIDLLNGADQFETWLDTPLPTGGGICPSS